MRASNLLALLVILTFDCVWVRTGLISICIVEALTILQDTAGAFLADQISLDESLKQARDRLAQLA